MPHIIPEAGLHISSEDMERRASIFSLVSQNLESPTLHCIPYRMGEPNDLVAPLYDACAGKPLPWMDAYDPEVFIWRWMANSHSPYSDADDFHRRYIDDLAKDTDRTLFILVDPRYTDATPRGRPVGVASLMRNQPEHLAVEVGSIWFCPAYQGTNALPQMVLMMATHVFSLGYRRLVWSCNAQNERSARAAVRLGFTPEGQFRLWAHNAAGESRDNNWFSITQSEWASGVPKTKMEAYAARGSEPHKEMTPVHPSCLSPITRQIAENVTKLAAELKEDACVMTLVGKYIRLDPLDIENDCAELYAASNGSAQFGCGEYDPDSMLWRFLFQSPPQCLMDFVQTAESLKKMTHPFTISCLATNRKIGVITVCNNVPQMLRAELGNIWITPAYQGTAALPEATLLLVKNLFVLGYRRVEWKCDALNQRSQDAAVRMGFKPEAVFRNHMIVKGRARDTAWFAIAGDADYKEAVEKLEAIIERRAARGTPTSADTPI